MTDEDASKVTLYKTNKKPKPVMGIQKNKDGVKTSKWRTEYVYTDTGNSDDWSIAMTIAFDSKEEVVDSFSISFKKIDKVSEE